MNIYICNLLLKIHAGMNGLEAECHREGKDVGRYCKMGLLKGFVYNRKNRKNIVEYIECVHLD